MTSIANALSAVASAIDIARALAGAGGSVERADLKLRLADLTEALATAKLALTDAELERRQLEERLRARESATRGGDAYFVKDDPDPHCSRCLELDDRLLHLVKSTSEKASHRRRYLVCPECKTEFSRDRICPPGQEPLGPDDDEGDGIRMATIERS